MVPGGKNHASCPAGIGLDAGVKTNTISARINTKFMSQPEIISLPEIIIDRIQKEGVLSFHDFMEMALYFPGYGYYTSDRQKTGKSGDFYTSPYLTGLFGEMIGGQLEEMWQILGRKPFTIVEYGAGTGLLCRDILTRLKQNGELYDKLQYVIIEKSGSAHPPLSGKVTWADSIRDIPAVTGCILSNELVDNFSVHQVVMEDELMEVCVSFDDGFTETLRPAPEPLRDYLRRLGVTLPRGFRTEQQLRSIRTLLLGIGQKFKVLIQRKGVERVWLSGLQFPQPLI
jgi:SAM-dependent MidA family methyltransferase